MSLYYKYKPYLIVACFILFSTLIAWLPFLAKQTTWFGLEFPQSDFHYIYRNYDGPLYIIAAKTWYSPAAIEKIKTLIDIPPVRYFAAHLPLYPATLILFGSLIGYLKGMIFSTVFFSILLGWFFYYIVSKLKLTSKPLLLTCVFLMLPRFLVVRSVGAPESMFLLLILASLFFFEKKQFLLGGFLGGLSVMTKTPGILLFPAYGLVVFLSAVKEKRINWRWLWLLLIPAGFFAFCFIYQQQYGDFWAYFKSGDNIHLVAPYAAFNASKVWVGTIWLEDILFYFFMYALTIFSLRESKYRSFFYFGTVYFIAVLFVQHRDISRYSLPLWPLACIAFEKYFTSRKFLIASVILLPAIYMYVWNFFGGNMMPIQNWTLFM